MWFTESRSLNKMTGSTTRMSLDLNNSKEVGI